MIFKKQTQDMISATFWPEVSLSAEVILVLQLPPKSQRRERRHVCPYKAVSFRSLRFGIRGRAARANPMPFCPPLLASWSGQGAEACQADSICPGRGQLWGLRLLVLGVMLPTGMARASGMFGGAALGGGLASGWNRSSEERSGGGGGGGWLGAAEDEGGDERCRNLRRDLRGWF